jgi:hypothetical protein
VRAVWSFWTKPFKAYYRSAWMSEKHHLFAWVLSVETAKKHYPNTYLYTDDEGARLLIDGIGLEFERVFTELNVLDDHDPEWWALGKLYTYRSQTEPFVHIDNDVFLWKPLPPRMESAPVFAQHPEYFSTDWDYKPEQMRALLKNLNGGWIPEEFEWYISQMDVQRGENCGIFGGNQLDFIQYYADTAMKLVEHPINQTGWSFLGSNVARNLLAEQYLLTACIEYQKNRQVSPYKDINIQYLFNSYDDAFNPDKAREAGYTHLLGGAKRNRAIAQRLENRVKSDYPEYYERCLSKWAKLN